MCWFSALPHRNRMTLSIMYAPRTPSDHTHRHTDTDHTHTQDTDTDKHNPTSCLPGEWGRLLRSHVGEVISLSNTHGFEPLHGESVLLSKGIVNEWIRLAQVPMSRLNIKGLVKKQHAPDLETLWCAQCPLMKLGLGGPELMARPSAHSNSSRNFCRVSSASWYLAKQCHDRIRTRTQF